MHTIAETSLWISIIVILILDAAAWFALKFYVQNIWFRMKVFEKNKRHSDRNDDSKNFQFDQTILKSKGRYRLKFRRFLPVLLKWAMLILILNIVFYCFARYVLPEDVFNVLMAPLPKILTVLFFAAPLPALLVFYSQIVNRISCRPFPSIEKKYEQFYYSLAVIYNRWKRETLRGYCCVAGMFFFIMVIHLLLIIIAAKNNWSPFWTENQFRCMKIFLIVFLFIICLVVSYRQMKLEKKGYAALNEAFERPEEEIPERVRALQEEILAVITKARSCSKYQPGTAKIKNSVFSKPNRQTLNGLAFKEKNNVFLIISRLLFSGGYRRKKELIDLSCFSDMIRKKYSE